MKFLAKPRFNWIDLMSISISLPLAAFYGWEFSALFLFIGGLISTTLYWRAYEHPNA